MQRDKKDGSRRYPKDKYPAYHRTYTRLKQNSSILNDAKRANDLYNAGALSGLSECKGSLLQLVGNPERDNMYLRDNTWYKALIPSAKKQLRRVLLKFKRWQKQQVQKGIALKPPKKWPNDLLEERLKAEALLDIRYLEKAKVEKRIEQLKVQRGKTKKEEILPDGPVGRFQGGGGGTYDSPLKKVDGQAISFSPSGIPYVSEADSPYDGMPVATYREMSKAWKRENRIRNIDLHERKNEFKAKAEEKGIDLPPMFTVRKFKTMIKGQAKYKGQENWPDFEKWPENPDWPEDAKPITEIENEAETETVGS